MSDNINNEANAAMSLKFIENVINGMKNNPTCIISSNVLQATNFSSAVTNHKLIDKKDHVFSNQLTDDVNPVDQEHAGTCWICSGMSMCRRTVINKLNVGQGFNLSLNHLMFWDKLERCNFFFTHIVKNRDCGEFDSARIKKFISNPISDGGYWHIFSDLVEKYGLIPDNVFKRRISSINTTNLNKLLKYKLREFASMLLSPNKDKNELCTGDAEVETLRQEFMAQIIRILVSMIGKPFYPNTSFDWAYVDKKGSKKIMKGMTPLKFYKEYCQIDFNDYVPIVNDPRKRHPYNKTYEMFSTSYMVKDRSTLKSHILLNLDFDENVKLIMKQIDAGIPVWFSCDVGKYANHASNVLDLDLYDLGLPFNTSFTNMSKSDRLDFKDSYACHVMCIVGYDLEDVETIDVVKTIDNVKEKKSGDNTVIILKLPSNSMTDDESDDTTSSISNKRKRRENIGPNVANKKGKLSNAKKSKSNKKTEEYYDNNVNKVIKFKVENSWGYIGSGNGFYSMTKEWFRQYGYEIIINKNLLNDQQQKYLNQTSTKLHRGDPLSIPLCNSNNTLDEMSID